MSGDTHPARLAPKVVVATKVALSFISLWRAAAVILGDLASTMFYVGRHCRLGHQERGEGGAAEVPGLRDYGAGSWRFRFQ
jgi:hypothetical protein